MAPKGNISSSSSIAFSDHVVKSSNMPHAPNQLKIAKNNFVANFSIPSNVNGFTDIVKFLSKHPISSALTRSTAMYPTHLLEFWYTCDHYITATSKESIAGTVLGGDLKISITLRKLRNALSLTFNEHYEEPVSANQAKEDILPFIGYNFQQAGAVDVPLKGTVVRSKMGKVWNYFFAHIIHCLSGKSGSFDQATTTDLQIAHALIFGHHIDFAKLIFSNMVVKVKKPNRDPIIPYTRFFSLLLEDMLGDTDQLNETPIYPPLVGVAIFFNKKADATGGNLTEALLKVVRSKTSLSSQFISSAHSSEHADPGASVSQLNVTGDSIQQEETSSPSGTMSLIAPSASTKVPQPSSIPSLTPPLHLSKGKRSKPKARKLVRLSSMPRALETQPIVPVSSQKDPGVQRDSSPTASTSQNVGGNVQDITQVPTESVAPSHIPQTSLHSESA